MGSTAPLTVLGDCSLAATGKVCIPNENRDDQHEPGPKPASWPAARRLSISVIDGDVRRNVSPA